MQRWAYLILTVAYGDDALTPGFVKALNGVKLVDWRQNSSMAVPNVLNAYGADGWELVEVVWRMRGGEGGPRY